MNKLTLKNLLISHEGLRLKPYKCSSGKLTIGYGRNLEDKGISEAEAMMLLQNDIDEVLTDLNRIFSHYFLLPDNIQLVLADMRYNLGHDGFLQFEKLRKAVNQENWKQMQEEMINSKWYGQVGDRAIDLVTMVEEVK